MKNVLCWVALTVSMSLAVGVAASLFTSKYYVPSLVSEEMREFMESLRTNKEGVWVGRLFVPHFIHAPVPRSGFKVTPKNDIFTCSVVVSADRQFVAGIYVEFAPDVVSHVAEIETDWHEPVMVEFRRGPGIGQYRLGERKDSGIELGD